MYYLFSSLIVISAIVLLCLSPAADKRLSLKTNRTLSAVLILFFVVGTVGALYVSIIFHNVVNDTYSLISKEFASWADDAFHVIFKWEAVFATAVLIVSLLFSLLRKKAAVLNSIFILVSDLLLLIIAPIYSFTTENKNADIKTYILTYTLFICLILLSENAISFIKPYIKQKAEKAE